jgi:hypothetical protein
MNLVFGVRSCSEFRLLKLGDLDRGARFDVVQQVFQAAVVGVLALFANGPDQAV